MSSPSSISPSALESAGGGAFGSVEAVLGAFDDSTNPFEWWFKQPDNGHTYSLPTNLLRQVSDGVVPPYRCANLALRPVEMGDARRRVYSYLCHLADSRAYRRLGLVVCCPFESRPACLYRIL